MFAVIKTGGKQYRVAAEDTSRSPRSPASPATSSQFGEVLVRRRRHADLGAPTVAGAIVAAEVMRAGPRPEGHRLQEAPAQEFAAQARPSAGIHPGADHRDPHRWRQANQGGTRRPKRARPGARCETAPAEAAARFEGRPADCGECRKRVMISSRISGYE